MATANLVAIFRSTFHVTKGNIIDWSRTNDDISLEGVEFTSLPSGLHLVEKDVIYFSKGVYQGVCVFHRKVTAEEGQRGSRLFSVGVLVAPSERQRQWEHLPALRRFASGLDDSPEDLTPLNDYFEANQYQKTSDSSKARFISWEDELSVSNDHPALHLPHLLRIIGPSSITLFKYVLARRRVLIHTQPPVEAACVLAQLTSDLAFGNGLPDEPTEGVAVLGIIGLTDVDRLQNETWKRNGWIACTTDAIFLEKPHLYDLVIDLTTLTPSRSSRPNFYTSRPVNITTRGRGPTHRLQSVRYTFSDLRLWGDVEGILKTDANEASENGEQVHGHYHYHSSSGGRWTDVWQVYEDVCMVCAGLWIGSWRSSQQSRNNSTRGAGQVILEGGDTVLSDLYLPSEASTSTIITSTAPGESVSISASPGPRQLRTTLSLLSAFHQHSSFIQTRLSELLPEPGSRSSPLSISARDVSRFELGLLSELDGLFLEWLAESRGVKIKIRRGWTDIIVAILGFG